MSYPNAMLVPRRAVCLLLATTCGLAGAVAAAHAQQSSLVKVTQAAHSAASPDAAAIGAAAEAVSSSTAAQIQRINERMALLQAQLNELELQAKISAKRKEIDSAGPTAGSPVAFDNQAGLPWVQSVAGLRGRLEAVLVFAGGVTERVKAGDVIAGRRVARVSLNEVVLTDLQGHKAQRLTFGAAPALRESAPVFGLPAPLLPIPAGVLAR